MICTDISVLCYCNVYINGVDINYWFWAIDYILIRFVTFRLTEVLG